MLWSMRSLSICLAVTLAAGAVVIAQQPAAPTVTYRSAADVAALIASAKAKNGTKAQALISQNILSLAPYKANLEYRAAVAAASVHLKEAELFYVVDGSATLITGGKLVNQTQTNADNLSGTAIEGGNSQALAKGDFVIVPEGTPHWFSEIKSTLVLMSMHVPRPVPAAK
jgi:mannose-6-phosphate isomerase-like protein (cupin superfamily)